MIINVNDGAKLKFKFGSKTSAPAVLSDTTIKKESQDIQDIVNVEPKKVDRFAPNIAEETNPEDEKKMKEWEDAKIKMAKARSAKKPRISLLDLISSKK